MNIKQTILLLAISVGISSCFTALEKKMRGDGNTKVHGDGNIISETRAASGFTNVDVSGNIDIAIRNDATFSTRIETDANLQKHIEAYVDGQTLHIRTKQGSNLHPTKGIKVFVSAPAYRRFEVSGACNITTENEIIGKEQIEINVSGSCDGKLAVNAPKTSIDISGAGSLILSGKTKELAIDGSGSTDVKAFGLAAEVVAIDISGAGNVQVYASSKLSASASGSGNVLYKGTPVVNSNISGAGSVKHVD